jgi:hypothetical protein
MKAVLCGGGGGGGSVGGDVLGRALDSKKRKYDQVKKPIACTLEEDSPRYNKVHEQPDLDKLLAKVQSGTSMARLAPNRDGSVKIPTPLQQFNFGQGYVPGMVMPQRKVSALSEKLDSARAAVSSVKGAGVLGTPYQDHRQVSQTSVTKGVVTAPTGLTTLTSRTLVSAGPIRSQVPSTSSITPAGNGAAQRNHNVTIIGSAKINTDKLLANSTKSLNLPSRAAPIASSKHGPSAMPSGGATGKSLISTKDRRQDNLTDDISELLNRKSAHHEEAEDEWFDDYGKRMDKLAKREYKMAKNEATINIHIQAFHCLDCNLITETIGPLCRPRSHRIKAMTAVKRFFECVTCLKRDYTLGASELVSPKLPCKICGIVNWRPCGIRGTELGHSSIKESSERLVTTATDWTSRKDLERIKSITNE